MWQGGRWRRDRLRAASGGVTGGGAASGDVTGGGAASGGVTGGGVAGGGVRDTWRGVIDGA